MLQGLRTAMYDVTDLGRAKAWYATLVGHPPYFDEPFYVGFDVGGYELGLHPAEAACHFVYWGVTDVPKALARAIELGATPRSDAEDVGGGIVVGAVNDPFGNPLGVIYNPHFAPPLVDAKADEISDRALVQEALVRARPEEAFALWTSSEGMAKWWIDKSRIELRPGGLFELIFLDDMPPGSQGSEGCRILSYVPGRMLSFTWNAPPHLPQTRNRHTWVVLDLTPEGEGTRVRLTHLGWPIARFDEPGSQWPETYAYFEEAWGRVLERFAAHFGGR